MKKFFEWLDENIGGKMNVIFDYGVIDDNIGMHGWKLSMALRQREGYSPTLTFKLTYGSQLKIRELETSSEILQKVEASIQDAIKVVQTLYIPPYKPIGFFSKLFLLLLAHSKVIGKVIVDYGVIYDHYYSGGYELSMALRQPYRQHSTLTLTWRMRHRGYEIDAIDATPEILHKIKAVIRDAHERLYKQKAT